MSGSRAYISMATSSLPPSPAFTCSVCQMFSYSSASFSDNGICNKCSLFVVLEARLSELEARLCTVENHPIVNQAPLASEEPPSLASSFSHPLAEPEQPGPQSGWVTVRKRSHSPKVKFTINLSTFQTDFPHSATHPLRTKPW